MSDIEARIREKLITIQSLNQKIEILQAQLSGAQKRAHDLTQQVAAKDETLAEKDIEIRHLTSEIERFKSALERVGQEVKDHRAAQIDALSKKKDVSKDDASAAELEVAKRTIQSLRENLKQLSEAATAVLNVEPDATEQLRSAVQEVGDPQFRILNIVLTRRAAKIDELASALVIDTAHAWEMIDALVAAGEVQMRDKHTVIPAAKYRETKIPVESWQQAEPAELFDDLEEIVSKIEGNEGVAKAIETAVDILEQKLSRSGALVFEMRRTASSWKKQPGDIQELKYKIRDWKARAV